MTHDLPDPPETIVRRLVPLYLRARDRAAAIKPGHPGFASAREVRDTLSRRVLVQLARCTDCSLAVPESGVRVAIDRLEGLVVLPLPGATPSGPKPGRKNPVRGNPLVVDSVRTIVGRKGRAI